MDTDKKALLGTVVTSLIRDQSSEADEAFHSYLTQKMRDLVGIQTQPAGEVALEDELGTN